MSSVKKWRSIPKALKEIREIDPGGALTERALRNLVKKGEISHLKNGRIILIDMNEIWGTGAEES